ncbi:MAG: hypothetical protein ABIH34_04580 [Nanoarchaeota archaeon]
MDDSENSPHRFLFLGDELVFVGIDKGKLVSYTLEENTSITGDKAFFGDNPYGFAMRVPQEEKKTCMSGNLPPGKHRYIADIDQGDGSILSYYVDVPKDHQCDFKDLSLNRGIAKVFHLQGNTAETSERAIAHYEDPSLNGSVQKWEFGGEPWMKALQHHKIPVIDVGVRGHSVDVTKKTIESYMV